MSFNPVAVPRRLGRGPSWAMILCVGLLFCPVAFSQEPVKTENIPDSQPKLETAQEANDRIALLAQTVSVRGGASSMGAGDLLLHQPTSDTQASSQTNSSQFITGKQRLRWVVSGTVGPRSLGVGLFTSGIRTARNKPPEYGPSWSGFGKRYGIRLSSVATNHAIEAGLGAVWGEDPRYVRASERGTGTRVRHMIKMAFATRRKDEHLGPAYARFIGVTGGSFLSNTWRVHSEADASSAVTRILFGFLGRMASNAFREFWPTK